MVDATDTIVRRESVDVPGAGAQGAAGHLVRQFAIIGGGKMGGAIATRAVETGLLPPIASPCTTRSKRCGRRSARAWVSGHPRPTRTP
jgi:hypothetical protein